MLDSYIYWMILILFFDDGTMKTSNTHPNRQQIPQHWHQETADTSKMRQLESLLYLRKQKVIKIEYQYLALTMPLQVFRLPSSANDPLLQNGGKAKKETQHSCGHGQGLTHRRK